MELKTIFGQLLFIYADLQRADIMKHTAEGGVDLLNLNAVRLRHGEAGFGFPVVNITHDGLKRFKGTFQKPLEQEQRHDRNCDEGQDDYGQPAVDRRHKPEAVRQRDKRHNGRITVIKRLDDRQVMDGSRRIRTDIMAGGAPLSLYGRKIKVFRIADDLSVFINIEYRRPVLERVF